MPPGRRGSPRSGPSPSSSTTSASSSAAPRAGGSQRAHFAERHGLIIIVALGESIVAVGAGVADEPITAAVVARGVLGLGVSVALWWVYFDVVALVAERVLLRLEGEPRSRLARDSYTYLHFPMLAGIVYLALGMKKVLEYVADTEHHDLSDPLPGCPPRAVRRRGALPASRCPRSAAATSAAGTCSAWWPPRRCCSCCRSPAQLPALAALGVLAGCCSASSRYEALVLAADARRRPARTLH